ncbi:MAG: hypothetical protein BZ137_05675 [Methanosphaera sp. rholeuAM130]|nr:hypothetical protein [Methanosphaera sp.]RAP53811.1 MAG: hypothetical protein BZ137_05675 [Methanosphaera sp. rholeuAM130]
MSNSTVAKVIRGILLFLGGIALGYSIKTLNDNGSLEELKNRTRDITYKPSGDDAEYVDIEIKDNIDEID